jgi:hypothetical protein
MRRSLGEISCPQCAKTFEYLLVHTGLNECAYAYCEACGNVAMLHARGELMPPVVRVRLHRRIDAAIEPHLAPCECGGRFRASAGPRCPSCRARLSAEALAAPIEEDAPATRDGWRWQRTWSGLYCFVVNNRWVEDNWIK